MDPRRMRVVLRLVGIGWYVGLCIGGGAFGGLWLDRWLDLAPILTLVGLGLGIGLAGAGMYRMLMAVLAVSSAAGDEENS